MTNTPVLYINGLGDGAWNRREHIMASNLERHGHRMEHAHLDWLANGGFESRLQETVGQAETILRDEGRLAIVGSSAGGSMAVNVFGALESEDVFAVNMCGRLAEGDLAATDWRTLDNMAHLGTSRASQSFYDSVKFCEEETVPNLTDEQKKRLLIFHQLFDFVVPHQTMLIPGVDNKRLAVIGHGLGIFLAGRMLPELLSENQNGVV
ncbi:MAG TPA: hypothetical protein VN554_01440 [Verrucomicrobiae bacterium]|nr:hypothetical protein [Verrucomicrobiae bacterium]